MLRRKRQRSNVERSYLALKAEVLEQRELLTGDANLDLAVDFTDFLILSANYGGDGGVAQGDFNDDGQVGFPDFLILAENYGEIDKGELSFVKTRQGDTNVWVGNGGSEDGAVAVTATLADMLFEVIGNESQVSLPLTQSESCSGGDVCFAGPLNSELVANQLNGGRTFEGEVSFDSDDGRQTIAFSKTRLDDTLVWEGTGRSDSEVVNVRATLMDMSFEISGPLIDLSFPLTQLDDCSDGNVCFAGPANSNLVASTPDEGVTFEGSITFDAAPPTEDIHSEFGPDDEIGAANHLSAETVLAAAEMITEGKVYSLAQILEVDSPTNAFVSHELILNIVISGPDGLPADAISVPFGSPNDFVALAETVTSSFMHVGTQFDALGHIGIGDVFYNGNSFEDIFTPTGIHRLGVEEVPPFFTRGILIDVAAAKGVESLDPAYEITASDLELALARQGMIVETEGGGERWDINPGDVVLVHTGWGSLYNDDPETFVGAQPGLGVGAAQALAANDVLMVGADNVFVDVFPNPGGLLLPVHQELLTKNGIYMMEVVKTDELARDEVYEYAFSFAPIRVEGGTGSAAHPFVII